jgi:PhzF family phenazine biosynthesis protein
MKYYVVDAFAEKVFEGNPAGICVLDSWLPDETMQKIAMENNLSETAFTVKESNGYRLRWFTPGKEVDLCGHGTLATAFVLMRFFEPSSTELHFNTLSGTLSVVKKQDLYEMDMPAYDLKPTPVTEIMTQAIGYAPVEAWMGRDLVCVLENETQVRSAAPDRSKTLELDGLLLHLTARGTEFDCISRSFAPKVNVSEDPVCGSGHCHIAPLWAGKLGKNKLAARQVSSRGGILYCQVRGERVSIAGKAALYSIGELFIETGNAF